MSHRVRQIHPKESKNMNTNIRNSFRKKEKKPSTYQDLMHHLKNSDCYTFMMIVTCISLALKYYDHNTTEQNVKEDIYQTLMSTSHQFHIPTMQMHEIMMHSWWLQKHYLSSAQIDTSHNTLSLPEDHTIAYDIYSHDDEQSITDNQLG